MIVIIYYTVNIYSILGGKPICGFYGFAGSVCSPV